MAQLVKMCVFGGGGVGKSASTIRFTRNQFIYEYDPTIEDNYRKQCLVDNEVSMIDIVDLSGEEEYAALREQLIRNVKGYMLVYSITSRSSLDELSGIREQILRVRDLDYVPMVVIGNKCDLEMNRQVSFEEGKELATLFECPFFETSAKEGTNIEEAFLQLLREIRKFVEPQLVK